ncbi:MAG: class I SAM-dependent methyltransferase [Acidobacteria bacterium]|nr:class I SAM-dependent methyltransferase [Acidobacteriota bacterium]
MHEETNGHARRDGETAAAPPPDQERASAPTKVDRRPWSLAVKTFICAAATLTLLGGSLGFSLQRLERERELPDDLLVSKSAPQRPATNQAPARERDQRDADKIDRPTSEPYTGDLSIFEDLRRDTRLQIERVLDVLKIKEGSAVADIGAGSGWFTVRAARRVGAGGAVYAVEINPKFIAHIEERAKREALPQVRTVLGKEDDPLLPPGSADAVLILKTYHEIAEPVRLMKNLRKSLRPGALVGIIDRDGKGNDHGLDAVKVIKEVERAGYALAERHDFVKGDDMDYFLVFRARG